MTRGVVAWALFLSSCSSPSSPVDFDCLTGLSEYEIDGRPYLYCVSERDGSPHFFWLDEALEAMDADGFVSDAWIESHGLPREWFDDGGFPVSGGVEE